MGLLSQRQTDNITIDTPEGDWYELRTQITGYERDKIKDAAMIMQVPRGKVEDESAMVDAVLNLARQNRLKKQTFVTRWSWDDHLNPQNLDKIPLHHHSLLIKKIDELMEAQEGLKIESPLVIASKPSSNGQLQTESLLD